MCIPFLTMTLVSKQLNKNLSLISKPAATALFHGKKLRDDTRKKPQKCSSGWHQNSVVVVIDHLSKIVYSEMESWSGIWATSTSAINKNSFLWNNQVLFLKLMWARASTKPWKKLIQDKYCYYEISGHLMSIFLDSCVRNNIKHMCLRYWTTWQLKKKILYSNW